MFIKYLVTTAMLVLCTLGIVIFSSEIIRDRKVRTHPETIKSHHQHHPPFIKDNDPIAQRV